MKGVTMLDKVLNLPQKICFVIASFLLMNSGDRIIDFGGKANDDNLGISVIIWFTIAYVVFLNKK